MWQCEYRTYLCQQNAAAAFSVNGGNKPRERRDTYSISEEDDPVEDWSPPLCCHALDGRDIHSPRLLHRAVALRNVCKWTVDSSGLVIPIKWESRKALFASTTKDWANGLTYKIALNAFSSEKTKVKTSVFSFRKVHWSHTSLRPDAKWCVFISIQYSHNAKEQSQQYGQLHSWIVQASCIPAPVTRTLLHHIYIVLIG